ncbi:MAG TPA: hypothetical protein VIL20_25400 [Sandaracinaceae bacterium]
MATTTDAGAPPRLARSPRSFGPDELARGEPDAHEEPTGDLDPARPGRRGGMALLVGAGLFLLAVAFFFYALAGG